jgi:hypothetical protein
LVVSNPWMWKASKFRLVHCTAILMSAKCRCARVADEILPSLHVLVGPQLNNEPVNIAKMTIRQRRNLERDKSKNQGAGGCGSTTGMI